MSNVRLTSDFIGGIRLARRLLAASTCLFVLHAGAVSAQAQEADPGAKAGTAETADPVELVVTGSRLAREGFTAPTPVVTLGSEEISRRNPTTIGEILTQIPSFRATLSTTSGGTRTRGGAVDRSDLRGLNDTFATRTLVLVDGRRFVPSGSDGAVDLKLIPTGLIEQVEVVTGGASAAWGSDAVAGVVNFKLRDRVDGVEVTASSGLSQRGDNAEYRLSLAGGYSLGERIRGVIGGDYLRNEGVPNQYSRRWGREEYGLVTNTGFATNGLPNFIISPDVRPANMTPGGLIVSGPLRGIAFGPNGTTSTFDFGQLFGSSMIGGGNEGQNLSNATLLSTPIEAVSGFTHADFDIAPEFSLFGELMGAWSKSTGQTQQPRDAGTLTINADNAYLPASVRTRMAEAGVSTIAVGRLNNDTGPVLSDARNTTLRGVFGAKGDLGDGWSWDAYYQYGRNRYVSRVGPNNRIQANYRLAIDAVVDPVSHNIVCRSSLANPGNGCIPINIFGDGSAVPNDYAFGTSYFRATTTQQVAELNLRGEPFSTWAGPVSVAAGGGWRKEGLTEAADPISSRPNANGSFGGWAFNNQMPVNGKYDLWEVYGEALLPLARDVAFAKSLELNGAIRRTDYSLSGGVTTWKVGLSYEPVAGLRFRGTRSRDIRAPNLAEIYEGGGSAQAVVFDRVLGSTVQLFDLAIGNLDLKPEIAETWTGGVVYEPGFAPGLSLSLDYYNIKIDGAISSLSPALRVQGCYDGVPGACDNVVFNPNGTIAYITHASENLNALKTSGVDFELSYQRSLDQIGISAPGRVSLHLMGTYVDKLVQFDAAGPLDKAGWLSLNSRITGVPKFSGTVDLNYSNDSWTLGLLGRLIGKGKFSNLLREGAGAANTINDNSIPAYFYLSLNTEVRVPFGDKEAAIFAVVNNLTDTDPPMIPSGAVGNAAETATNPAFYDVVGRSFKFGVRLKF